VLIRQNKTGRDRVVPLMQETGSALARYVLKARRRSCSSRVFLTQVPPVRPFSCSGSISKVVRDRLEQGNVHLPGRAGAHLLRHCLATRLVGQSRPINEIADLLGHQHTDTTSIYIKVALPQLAAVALPFPEGVP
jgi:integrase/recombinase XerD